MRDCKKLQELYTKAKMIGAAYLAVAQAANPAVTTCPAVELSNVVAELCKVVMEEEERKP